MYVGPVYATSPWSKQLAEQLSEKEFRDEYMIDQVRTNIAFQIRALREQQCRDWTQAELADRAGTTQSVISRLENPDYGSMTLQTLLEVACAFDVPLLLQFVDWEDWLERMSDVSPTALQKRAFNRDRLLALAESYGSAPSQTGRVAPDTSVLSPPQPVSRWLGSVSGAQFASYCDLLQLSPVGVRRSSDLKQQERIQPLSVRATSNLRPSAEALLESMQSQ